MHPLKKSFWFTGSGASHYISWSHGWVNGHPVNFSGTVSRKLLERLSNEVDPNHGSIKFVERLGAEDFAPGLCIFICGPIFASGQ